MSVPQIDWDFVNSREQFEKTLLLILAGAEQALGLADVQRRNQERGALHDLLGVFVQKLPLAFDELSAAARNASNEIMLTDVRQALQRIRARHDDLLQQTGNLGELNQRIARRAAALRLEKVIRTLDQAKEAVEAFQQLQDDLKDTDKTLFNKLAGLPTVLREVRDLARQSKIADADG